MSYTIVTGANGYIASHIVSNLLKEGKNVIGTVRSFNKAADLIQAFSKEFKSGQLKFIEVDFEKRETIENIFKTYPKEISTFIHPAQNFGKNAKGPEDYDREIIQYTRNTVDDIIHIVESSDAPIERFVYFSTSVAVRGVEYDFNHTFTEADFPDVSYEEAKGDWMKAYTFAKVNAEKKILSHKSKRGIEYKIVVPPTVIGPSIAPWNTGDEVQSNNRFLYQIFKGEKPARTVEWWADVRSIADAAVQAGDKSKTRGVEHNRYVIVDGTENYHEIIPILLKHFKDYNPGNWEELFASIQDDVKDRKIAKRDLHITESEVKHDSITFEQSVINVVNEFLKIRD